MSLVLPHVEFASDRCCWHITFGTFGARLHGDDRPTVDRSHNIPGTDYLGRDPRRRAAESNAMNAAASVFTIDQRTAIEAALPSICERGRWNYFVGAAGPDHVHVLCDAPSDIHGDDIRKWMKRWVGEELDRKWRSHRVKSWWAEGGSNKPVKDAEYISSAFIYILKQRCDADGMPGG